MNLETIRNHYGILIVLITFLTRVVFVGFSWSYGTVIAEFKKHNTTLSDTELSWIGSVGQSFGGLVAPIILFAARRYGFQLTFILSLIICILSLLFSSFVNEIYWLLITYSFPYGFANAAIFILGTLICGLYYPANQHPHHVLVMCLISTGFPIGYHIMSAFVLSSIEEFGWQTMKRRVAMIELLVTCVLGPFFTTKCLPLSSQGHRYSTNSLIPDSQRRIFYSKEILYWMLGIFTAMCAVNNFLLHLHSHLEYLLMTPERADLWFRLHGLFDAIFRLSIPLIFRFYSMDIIYIFPTSVFTGIIVLTLTAGLLYTSLSALAIVPIILFSFTSAVVTALQYTVSNRLFDEEHTEQGYVYHIIVTSLGTILGPVIGGFLFDLTGSYKSIIPTSIFFLFISFVSFGSTIIELKKKKVTDLEATSPSIYSDVQPDYGSAN